MFRQQALTATLDKLLAHAEDKDGIFAPPENPLIPTPSKPGTQIGHYQLIRSLGRDGMGQVFLTRQEEPQRDVAVKLLRAGLLDKSLSHRFKLEIEILGKFNHPGNAQICEAVQHAHEQGIIHRDLKPSNIMAAKQDDGVIRPRVLDFGVARATGTENPLATLYTIPGKLVGTLAYMSPEQVSGFSEDQPAHLGTVDTYLFDFKNICEKLSKPIQCVPDHLTHLIKLSRTSDCQLYN